MMEVSFEKMIRYALIGLSQTLGRDIPASDHTLSFVRRSRPLPRVTG